MYQEQEIEPYLIQLESLPFVETIEVEAFTPRPAQGNPDFRVRLNTVDGTHRFLVDFKRSHLTRAAVERIAHLAAGTKSSILVMAPYISPQMTQLLGKRDVNFVDLAGNCHVAVGRTLLAHVEGRRPVSATTRDSRLGAKTYQVLFALLAQPDLVAKPVRVIAEKATVSKSMVAKVLERMEKEGSIGRTRRGRQLFPSTRLLDRWQTGYSDVLRPQLMVGRFRAPELDPFALERRIEGLLEGATDWAWGGATAGFRLTGHFRGDETTLHVSGSVSTRIGRRLKVAPSATGNLTVVKVPGPLAFAGSRPRTAHPLLVYAELMTAGKERESEAATEILYRYLDAFE
ncbi:MAG: type IV toxin-antitoxin system AbiEi family antitoxin [Vicinamibacteria bacterium]